MPTKPHPPFDVQVCCFQVQLQSSPCIKKVQTVVHTSKFNTYILKVYDDLVQLREVLAKFRKPPITIPFHTNTLKKLDKYLTCLKVYDQLKVFHPSRKQSIIQQYKSNMQPLFTTSQQIDLKPEFEKYCNGTYINVVDSDVVQWWEANKDAFPQLAELALRWLHVPISSCDCERVFSRLNFLLSDHRKSLDKDTLDTYASFFFNGPLFGEYEKKSL